MRQSVLAVFVIAFVLLPHTAIAWHGPKDPVERSVITMPESGLDVIADSSDQRIYVAGKDRVLVYGFDGSSIGNVTGQTGAVRLALDTATDTLYVALRDAAAVSAIDTNTLQERNRWALGENQSPRYIALGAGRLWIGVRRFENAQPRGRIFSVDPTDPDSPIREDADNFYGAPQIAYGGGTLAATNMGSEPPYLTAFDVTGETPVIRSTKWNVSGDGRSAGHLVVSEDGETIYWAGGPAAVHALAVEDLSITRSYSADSWVTSVQVNSDETRVVVGGSSQDTDNAYAESIRVYRAEETVPDRATRTPSVDRLSLTADDEVLVVLSGPTLHLFSDPFTPSASLDGPPPNTYQQWWRGDTVVVPGTLRTRHGEPLVGKVIELTPSHSSPYGAHTAVTGQNGEFEFLFPADHLGTHQFFMTYAGEPEVLPAARRMLVSVKKRPSSLRLSRPRVAQAGDTVTVSAVMVTPAAGTIELAIQPYGKPKQVLKTAAVAPGQRLSATYRARTNTRVTARFLGDYYYASAGRGGTTLTAPVVRAWLTGYDDTIVKPNRRIRVFNNGRTLRLHGAVWPWHPGACYRGILQRRTPSRWADVTTWCAMLDDSSATITVPPVILRPGNYRIKAFHAADHDHTDGVSPTRYFRVR